MWEREHLLIEIIIEKRRREDSDLANLLFVLCDLLA